jgi:hypothetical protein
LVSVEQVHPCANAARPPGTIAGSEVESTCAGDSASAPEWSGIALCWSSSGIVNLREPAE